MKNFSILRFPIKFAGLNKWIALLIILFTLTSHSIAQVAGDAKRFFTKTEVIQNERIVHFGFEGKSKYNPISLFMASLMYSYQKIISPQISASCLYNPSCSAFSRQLISEYGLLKGSILTADRLMRCNRLAAYDIRKSQFSGHTHKIYEAVDIYCHGH